MEQSSLAVREISEANSHWMISRGLTLKGRIMNWYAFAFDSYKRARLSIQAADLRALKIPSEPGLVSVVLPAFNGARLLGEALDSILAQTYSKFEVIAINDGSTDETGAILDEYARRITGFK